MTLPKIDTPLTSDQLRRRAIAQWAYPGDRGCGLGGDHRWVEETPVLGYELSAHCDRCGATIDIREKPA